MGPLIEMLEAVRLSQGRQLVSIGGTSIEVPFFPASSTIHYSIAPPANAYAMIGYRLSFGSTPSDVYTLTLNLAGQTPWTGRVTRDIRRDGIDGWYEITAAGPLNYSLTNNDVIAQPWQATLQHISVATQADLELLYQIARRYRQSPDIERLLRNIDLTLASGNNSPLDLTQGGGI